MMIKMLRFPKNVFVKATADSIANRISTSFVCLDNNRIVGVCLIDYKEYDTPTKVWVIDTIVSTKRGRRKLIIISNT
jgi:hypothetical protein